MKIIVVGAGAAGLAVAARLAHAGHHVVVFEKNARPGGRIDRLETPRGFTIDTGPSLLLLPQDYREAFAACGEDLDDWLTLKRVDPLYRLHFADGTHLDLSSDVNKTARAIEKLTGKPSEGQGYARLHAQNAKYYTIARDLFIDRNLSIRDLLNPTVAFKMASVGARRSYWQHVARFVTDERVRAALTLQSIYIGATPVDIPAVYSVVQYAETEFGAWWPKDGFYQVALALEGLAKKQGAIIEYNRLVRTIVITPSKRHAEGVQLQDGSFVEADVVICNVDLPHAYESLVSPSARPSMTNHTIHKLETSCSAFMLYLTLDKRIPKKKLPHHSFILPHNFLNSLHTIFKTKQLPDDPGIYVCHPTATDPTLCPKNTDILFVLVPVPNRSAGIDWKDNSPHATRRIYRQFVLDSIEKKLGFTPNELQGHIAFENLRTPAEWETLYGIKDGAAFGLAPTLAQSAMFRPSNRAPDARNLYFVGASTHPGSGVPIVLISAKLVAERVLAEQGKAK